MRHGCGGTREVIRCPYHLVAVLLHQCRCYTPIFSPEPQKLTFARAHTHDEMRTLWSRQAPIPSVSKAVEWWLRCGNNAVVHSSQKRDTETHSSSSSPFCVAEDYVGTNLVTGTAEHLDESMRFWFDYFERRYVCLLRHERRTASQHIGAASASGELTDEADQPHTRWDGDTYFRELQYICERHLKQKFESLLALEKYMWFAVASPEEFLGAFDALQQQRSPALLPLPTSSVWFYTEKDQRAQWAAKYLPAAKEAMKFFDDVLSLATDDKEILARVADQLQKIHEVLVQRRERQIKANLCPGTTPNDAVSQEAAAALHKWCEGEAEREQRSIEEGTMDPEDVLDDSEEWKREHESLTALATEVLTFEKHSAKFTLEEFWRHTIRREELETLHVHTDDGLRSLTAAARALLYREVSYAAVLSHLATSVRRGRLDRRSAALIPFTNGTWCKWHYAKFGGSCVAQHTHVGKRRLLYHYMASAEEVAATATLYFHTKPLSSSMDYASPYKFRRSLVHLCASYGVEMMRAIQRPELTSVQNLAQAESAIALVCRAAATPFGALRRAYDRESRHIAEHEARLVRPITSVCIHEELPELLEGEGGGDVDESLVVSDGPRRGAATAEWPIGGVRLVTYEWDHPALAQLPLVLRAGPMTAERAVEVGALRQRCRLELSLWRRVTAEERAERRRAVVAEDQKAQEWMQRVPLLRDIHAYATGVYKRLSGVLERSEDTLLSDSTARGGVAAGEAEEWEFVAILCDDGALHHESFIKAQVPFYYLRDGKKIVVGEGEYRVRLRGYDRQHALGAAGDHPGLCAECFSEPFKAYDAVKPILQKYAIPAPSPSTSNNNNNSNNNNTNSDATLTCAYRVIRKEQWGTCCRSLREAAILLPLRCEFDAGQVLSPDGDVVADYFMNLLHASSVASTSASALAATQPGLEERCRAHWELHHPGADEEEWAVARYGVLHRAIQSERGWWWPDKMLRDGGEVAGVLPCMAEGSIDYNNGVAVHRYGLNLTRAMTAESSSALRDPLPLLSFYRSSRNAAPTPHVVAARCSVNGNGLIRSLGFDTSASGSEGREGSSGSAWGTLEDTLALAQRAVEAAQDRHATLTMYKMGPMERELQMTLFCQRNGLEMGGRFARTYSYAMEKAKCEIERERGEAGRIIPGVRDDDKERASEGEFVDRFASSTHPELRKTRFVERVTASGQNIEDPTPDQETVWGR